MDEELQKRNTDCVYFLASPLTCKKGIECEYRHSEIARLNPRDCWYWLAGNCINPTCAFRHPPLEGRTETLAESSVHKNTTNVPCYFYFNGFCNRGDSCSFLHGLNQEAPILILAKPTPIADATPLEKKTTFGSDTASSLPETHPGSSEIDLQRTTDIPVKPQQGRFESALKDVSEENASAYISASECEEVAAVNSVSLIPEEHFIQRISLSSDQSSDEQVDGHVEREEWLESSPGFDVLVDDRLENVDGKDENAYLLAFQQEGRELSDQFEGYDFEDLVDYGAEFPDARTLREPEIPDSYDHLEDDHTYDYVRNVPDHWRRISDCIFPPKRKFLPVNLAFNSRDGVDLRDHLKKHRLIDGTSANCFSRRHDSAHLTGQSRERSQRQSIRRLRGRLELKLEDSIVGSRTRDENIVNDAGQWDRLRYTRNRTNQRFRGKRLSRQKSISSKAPLQVISKKTCTEENSMFSGPKTLAQIKEEKQKAQASCDPFEKMRPFSGTVFQDFQGPKPLSEILKSKTRLVSVVECNNPGS